MAAHKHEPVEVDPLAARRAEEMWANFISFSKMGIISIAILLVLMLMFLY
jgi:hypothetical protein